MSLEDLIGLLDAYAGGSVGPDAIQARLLPILAADPLDVEASDSTPWDDTHTESRLFWRLVYLFESGAVDGNEEGRRTVRRIVACVRQTGSAELTFELLPVILDQDRFADITARHRAGIISRTGFLSAVAESGYPPHVKLWLEHASHDALSRLVASLLEERYDAVALALDAPPA